MSKAFQTEVKVVARIVALLQTMISLPDNKLHFDQLSYVNAKILQV